jgi:hypothetical protein
MVILTLVTLYSIRYVSESSHAWMIHHGSFHVSAMLHGRHEWYRIWTGPLIPTTTTLQLYLTRTSLVVLCHFEGWCKVGPLNYWILLMLLMATAGIVQLLLCRKLPVYFRMASSTATSGFSSILFGLKAMAHACQARRIAIFHFPWIGDQCMSTLVAPSFPYHGQVLVELLVLAYFAPDTFGSNMAGMAAGYLLIFVLFRMPLSYNPSSFFSFTKNGDSKSSFSFQDDRNEHLYSTFLSNTAYYDYDYNAVVDMKNELEFGQWNEFHDIDDDYIQRIPQLPDGSAMTYTTTTTLHSSTDGMRMMSDRKNIIRQKADTSSSKSDVKVEEDTDDDSGSSSFQKKVHSTDQIQKLEPLVQRKSPPKHEHAVYDISYLALEKDTDDPMLVGEFPHATYRMTKTRSQADKSRTLQFLQDNALSVVLLLIIGVLWYKRMDSDQHSKRPALELQRRLLELEQQLQKEEKMQPERAHL